MKESQNIITYKWNEGIYSLEDLVILVKYKKLTEDQFFEITRFNYAAVVQKL